MKAYKAPGPDGIQPIFYQKFLGVIGAVVAVVKKTFEEGRIPDNMNNILITLIPKQEKPATLAQCRPIPLCNVIYKVIAKVAVSRLRPLLEKLLSPNQNSFIPGRGTT
ncbi:UNVERIFIED_CONTAM: hypothetical protein Sangu_3224200 [Sesamum angustifolium]|uniref:Reverse transcriptase domain-containing protein n=1 Tax=Sesamum angustifolium TaxID=2727405 RepID=A0AAW2JKJ3_9LAMI